MTGSSEGPSGNGPSPNCVTDFYGPATVTACNIPLKKRKSAMNSTAFSSTIPAASAQQILSGSASERAAAIAQRCGGGRERHGTWSVCCPAHDDHPSLTIPPAGDNVLVYCRAGCDAQAVLHAIGLTWRDLFADDLPPVSRPKRPTHLGPRIPEPPGGPTQQNIALQVALELLIDDCKLLEVEDVKALFREAAADPLTRLWIDQQLRRHRLDPASVWRIIQPPPNPSTSGLRTIFITPPQGVSVCRA